MVDLFGHHEHMLHLSGFACFQLGYSLRIKHRAPPQQGHLRSTHMYIRTSPLWPLNV